MKPLSLLPFVMLLAHTCLAQPALQWAHSFGLTGNDIGYYCTVDGQGNSYLCGNFLNTVDFDPGAGVANLTSLGSSDAFLAKYDAAGNYLWAVSWGSATFENAYRCTLDPAGNVIVGGTFTSTIDLDPGPGSANFTPTTTNGDLFLSKFDPSGNLVWGRVFPVGLGGFIYQPVTDAAGNVYISGYYTNSIDVDPGPGTTTLAGVGSADAFFGKYTSSGNLVWAGAIASTGADYGNTIAVDAVGNVYVAGAFSATADFDIGGGTANLTSAGGGDIFLAKYSSTGALSFAKRMGAANDDGANHIMVDGTGNIHVMGRYQNTVDFDPNPGAANLTNLGGTDGFMAKYDNAGNYLYAFRIGGAGGGDVVTCGAFSADGAHYYLKGNFLQTVDFDPGAGTVSRTASGANTDLYFAKYTNAGALVWVGTMGNTSVDNAYAIAADATGAIWVSGSFQLTVDFDVTGGVTNRTSNGAFDAYLAKYQDGAVLDHRQWELDVELSQGGQGFLLMGTGEAGTAVVLERSTGPAYGEFEEISPYLPLPFEYLDAEVIAGSTYHYRFRSVDAAGWVQYSEVAVAQLPPSGSGAPIAFPSPSMDGMLHLSLPSHFTQSVRVRILDQAGRTLLMDTIPVGMGTVPLHTGLGSGIYLLEITHGTERHFLKWVVQ